MLKNVSQNKKEKLISLARVIISTSNSRAESFGMTMLEGLYFNKPLMCFDIDSGIKDIVKNNFNGYVIKKFNIASYSHKLRNIYHDDMLFNSMVENSKTQLKKFKNDYKKLYKCYYKMHGQLVNH